MKHGFSFNDFLYFGPEIITFQEQKNRARYLIINKIESIWEDADYVTFSRKETPTSYTEYTKLYRKDNEWKVATTKAWSFYVTTGRTSLLAFSNNELLFIIKILLNGII